jgi:3-(3-hydroxy-phenyl)propionate hydroxylase
MRMEKFRHGRVLFAGDAAHGVSPFGARGANSGVQDADNLCWKLALILRGEASEKLLDTYGEERELAADENILNSTRSTDFITPKNHASKFFRDAVLSLAKEYPFARRLVNSGRLSLPSTYQASSLNTTDSEIFDGAMCPGAPASDAPIRLASGELDWFVQLLGDKFSVMVFTDDYQTIENLSDATVWQVLASKGNIQAKHERVIIDCEGLLAKPYDARPGTTYLFRPDQHVAARWREFNKNNIQAALHKASLQGMTA